MSVSENILQSLDGRFSVTVSVRNKPAIAVFVKNKEIVIDVKNPLLALELSLEQLLKAPQSREHSLRKKLKDMGFAMKVKYNMFEFEL